MRIRSALILASVAGAAGLTGLVFAQSAGNSYLSQARGGGSLPGTLHSLVGEWEGTIQTRRADDWVSGSIVSVSNRLEDNGRTLSSCFDGFAFGKSVQGAAMWRAAPTGGAVEHSVYSSMLGRVMRCSSSPSETSEGFVLSGECGSGQAAPSRVEQVISVVDRDRYTIDYFAVSDSGQRTRMMSMDMSRIAGSGKSDAHALFSNPGLMKTVRSSMTGIATAGVATDK